MTTRTLPTKLLSIATNDHGSALVMLLGYFQVIIIIE